MKLVFVLALLSLVACEPKKSTGTSSKQVSNNSTTTTKNDLLVPKLKSNIIDRKNESCVMTASDIDAPIQGAMAITSSELANGAKGYYELKSMTATTSLSSGEVKLIEKRVGRRYSQSCKDLSGLAAFEIRYAAPKYFLAKDGSFGKQNGQRQTGQKYTLRFDPNVEAGRARASFQEVRLNGTIQNNLVDQFIELSNTNFRYFRHENGNIVIRTQKENLGDGTLRLVTEMEFEFKAR